MRQACGIINIRKPEEILKFQYNVTKMPQDNLIEKRGFCGIFQEETMYLVNALNVIDEVKKAVIGKDSCVEMVMMAILARGHILIEDIPGVGKTTMALAFSRACAMSQNRVQFTPDVLPADITGFSIYRKDTGKFEYQPGGGDVQPASGRRDQPYIPENTVRTARSDGRRKCDGGWHHKRSAEAVHRHGDTEPDRLIRNTDAAGIPAGSLYDLYFHGLPGYPKRNCHFKRPQKRQSGRSHFTGDPDERSADNAGRSRQNLYP